jgi:hypothetical protein
MKFCNTFLELDMNERIDNLMVKAGAYFGGEGVDYSNFDPKKFAELIVEECINCADIVGRVNLASGYPNSTAHHVKQKIKQHFGVEE